MYKSSIFNIVLVDGNELLLLNTIKGLSSVCRVSSENVNSVLELLDKDVEKIDTSIKKMLYENGFLIKKQSDEKQIREAQYNNFMSNRMLRLIILPTEQCNFRCKYCYEDFKRGKMSKELQEALVKYLQKNIQYYEGVKVSWFGGEPLLAMDVIRNLSERFIKICKATKRKYVSDITTNGYLLTPDVFKELIKFKVVEYQITIDGLREIHNSKKPFVDGSGTFDIVTNNLKNIKEQVNSRVFHIIIRSNVTADAAMDMKEFVDFFYELVGNDERFSFFLRPAGDWGGENRISEMSQKRINDDDICLVYQNFMNTGKKLPVYTHQSFYYPGGCMCYATFKNMYVIDSDGGLRKCTCGLDNPDYRIGNLEHNGDMCIDSDKHAKWIGNTTRFTEKCSDCSFSPLCHGASCPRSNIFEKPTNAEIRCPSEYKYILQTLKLLELTNLFPKI